MPSRPAWGAANWDPSTSSPACSTRISRPRWRATWRRRRSGPGSPGVGGARTPRCGPSGVSGSPPRWSVVIPAYNEVARLPGYLKDIQAYFEGRDEAYEILVVDDGSRD